jgi:hypothetical protein
MQFLLFLARGGGRGKIDNFNSQLQFQIVGTVEERPK